MITTASTAAGFAVSNDCAALRVGVNVIRNLLADTINYPGSITQLDDPVFTLDFGIVVANSGIYKYTVGVGAAAGSYAAVITQTFDALKKVFIDGNNIIVFTWKETAANSNKFDHKLYIYSNLSTTLAGFASNPVTGQTTEVPKIVVSKTLSKFVIYGKSSDATPVPFYSGKTIDYAAKSLESIKLPT